MNETPTPKPPKAALFFFSFYVIGMWELGKFLGRALTGN